MQADACVTRKQIMVDVADDTAQQAAYPLSGAFATTGIEIDCIGWHHPVLKHTIK